MKPNKLLILVLTIPLFAFSVAHKYYVSLTQIDYNETSRSLQITMNVFIDDMELAMNKTYDRQFNLFTGKEPKDSGTYFEDYLKKHFKVKLEGKEMNYNYIGRKYEGDVVFFYLEIEEVNEVKTIEIENTTLMEFFDLQRNLIKLKIKGKFDSLLLNKENAKGVLNF